MKIQTLFYAAKKWIEETKYVMYWDATFSSKQVLKDIKVLRFAEESVNSPLGAGDDNLVA